MKTQLKAFMLNTFLCLCISCGAVYGYDTYFATKIYTIDVVELAENLDQAIKNKKISQERAEEVAVDFANQIKTYPDNIVILQRHVVLENGKEIRVPNP